MGRQLNMKSMKVEKINVGLILLILSVLLLGCVPVDKQCSIDEDCVRAECCHASDAVNEKFKPDCEGKICTMECVPETTDCGYGEIKCVSGECKVVLK